MPRRTAATGAETNRLRESDLPVHRWYRFVLSFPAHLVRDYLERFGIGADQTVLDPFCGTGTTLVECKKLGVPCVGVEAHPMAWLASSAKLDWSAHPGALLAEANDIAHAAEAALDGDGLSDDPTPHLDGDDERPLRELPPDRERLLLKRSISPRPLHKALRLLEALDRLGTERHRRHLRVAFAHAVVHTSSNLRFGPEVGLGRVKPDAPVIAPWLDRVRLIALDLESVQATRDGSPPAKATVHHGDARSARSVLRPATIDAVITSPPYPNEKDYTRTTRLESVLLGLIRDMPELRRVKQGLVRSNTRGVYKVDDDDRWVADHGEIGRIADAIEARRIELGKTSGFERLYSRVTRLYFGGMARHLADLFPLLRPGAKLAYVVGDQASYLRIPIRTGRLLADLAEGLGYRVCGLDLFRTRFATATRAELREEVLVLERPRDVE